MGAMDELRVLVVGDEPGAAADHAGYVRRVTGFEVTGIAASAREALRILARHDIDLVLLDLGLPGGHGLEVARLMRATGATADIMTITAARDVELFRAAVSLGAVGYLLKPVTFADLRERLAAYRRYRAGLAEADTISQSRVNAVLRELRHTASPGAATPKGLAAEMLDRVIAALQVAGPAGASATEIGRQVGRSRVTARRYLQYLADEGRAQRRQRPGEAGRPEVVFSWRS